MYIPLLSHANGIQPRPPQSPQGCTALASQLQTRQDSFCTLSCFSPTSSRCVLSELQSLSGRTKQKAAVPAVWHNWKDTTGRYNTTRSDGEWWGVAGGDDGFRRTHLRRLRLGGINSPIAALILEVWLIRERCWDELPPWSTALRWGTGRGGGGGVVKKTLNN